jgi:ATP-dependent Clp endopeptidase proteolytic subunit ClpP
MARIQIYDSIGADGSGGVTAKGFVDQLARVPASQPVLVAINSPGGFVTDGLAIYNAIRSRPNVTTRVDSFAGSIASVIFLAGARREMAEHSWLMVHDPFASVEGGVEELRKQADVLARLRGELTAIYVSRTGLGRSKVERLMQEETWLDSAQAKQLGFCDVVIPDSGEARIAAHFDPSKYKNAPEGMKKQARAVKITDAHRAQIRRFVCAGMPEATVTQVVEQLAAEGRLAPAEDPLTHTKNHVATLLNLNPALRKKLDEPDDAA